MNSQGAGKVKNVVDIASDLIEPMSLEYEYEPGIAMSDMQYKNSVNLKSCPKYHHNDLSKKQLYVEESGKNYQLLP